MPLFKSPEEKLQSANDRLLRGDYTGAQQEFLAAAEAFGKRGQTGESALAAAYGVLMGLSVPHPTAADYARAVQALAPLGPRPLKLGPRSVNAVEVAREADLARQEAEVLALGPQTPEQHQLAGQRLQGLSLAYRQMGDQVLVLPELFRRGVVPASSKAPVLAALAEEELGEAEVVRNPKRAAEHNQNARNWWLQVGESARAEVAAQRVQRYGKAVKCWFCGREAAGEGINFRALPSDLAGFANASDGGALPDSLPAQNTVYACRPCAATVERMADQRAELKAKELEARINRMLTRMRSQAGIAAQWVPSELPP